MNVLEIVMRNFMAHADSRLRLPKTGVVLVTGPNGAGKSSIIEAASYGGWGETLRTTPPWEEGLKGYLQLVTSAANIERTATKSRKTLEWADDKGNATAYESPTKAQEALEKVLGAFDVWRRTHVFSSHDAAHFTLSTDADRKRLLESVLGLYNFDRALEACRADRRVVEIDQAKAKTLLDQLTVQLPGAKLRVEQAKKALAELPPPPEETADEDTSALTQQVAELTQQVRDAGVDAEAVKRQLAKMDAELARRHAAANEIDRRRKALGDGDCDKCGQPIPQSLRDSLELQAQHERDAATEQAIADGGTADLLRNSLAELQAEQQALYDRKVQIQAQLNNAANLKRARDHARTTAANAKAAAERTLQDCEVAVRSLEERVAKGNVIASDLTQKLNTLIATEVVLGMKGVRAHVLGRALAGIEQAANAWLARFGLDMSLELKPYTEKKSGGVSDAISLTIHGAGGGHGYLGASGGQRRRIDVALLLALAEVAGAAQGAASGTLFLDEVFDALDEDGAEAVRGVLDELSKERAVVVITHSRDIISRLNPVVRVRVKPGGVLEAA